MNQIKRICHILLRFAFNWQISDEKMAERINQLKEDVSGMFQAAKNNVVETMNLVDVVQRLGIDHHFEEQITTTLHSIHNADFNSGSLNEVSLRFRLLRQQGFWVPPGTIKNTVEPYFF